MSAISRKPEVSDASASTAGRQHLRVSDETVLRFKVNAGSAGPTQVNSTRDTSLVDWLISRVEKRCVVSISTRLRSELRAEFDKADIASVVARQFSAAARSKRSKAALKLLVYQEAALVFSAMPPLADEEHVTLDAFIDPAALQRMNVARSLFGRNWGILLEASRSYWEEELRAFRGDVIEIDERPSRKGLPVSVVLPSLARRYEHLLKRIGEISASQGRNAFELVLVLADPENFSEPMIEGLKEALMRSGLSSKIVFSKKNRISINRNLGSSVACGDILVFLDDDVALVGPVLERMSEALLSFPELGLVSVSSYEQDLRLHRPASYHLTARYAGDVYLANRLSGMVMAARAEIVRVLPFADFWPNYGEDEFLSRQVHKLGFFNAYVLADDAYVIHEHAQERATECPASLQNVMLHEALTRYLEERECDELRRRLSLFFLGKYGGKEGSIQERERFLEILSAGVSGFLDGDDSALAAMFKAARENPWSADKVAQLEAVAAWVTAEREHIVRFKCQGYLDRDFSAMNPCLGALGYRIAHADRQSCGAAPAATEPSFPALSSLRGVPPESCFSRLSPYWSRARMLWDQAPVASVGNKMLLYTRRMEVALESLFREFLYRTKGTEGAIALGIVGSLGRRQMVLCSDVDVKILVHPCSLEAWEGEEGSLAQEALVFMRSTIGRLCLLEDKLDAYLERLGANWWKYVNIQALTKILDLRPSCGAHIVWAPYEKIIYGALERMEVRRALTEVFVDYWLAETGVEKAELLKRLGEPELKTGLGGIYHFLTLGWLAQINGQRVLSEFEQRTAKEACVGMQALSVDCIKVIGSGGGAYGEELDFVQRRDFSRNLQQVMPESAVKSCAQWRKTILLTAFLAMQRHCRGLGISEAKLCVLEERVREVCQILDREYRL